MTKTRRDMLRFGLTASPTLLQFWLPLTAEAQCLLPLPIGSATAYALPTVSSQSRPSVAALGTNAAQLSKFREAVDKMKALTGTTPLRWESQASLHCASCGGGGAAAEDIHGTWSFLPWHRAFLYFHERILGKLVNQATLRIPYWDWESAASRNIPMIYGGGVSNPLWEQRNPAGPLADTEVNVRPILVPTDWKDVFGAAAQGGAAYSGPHARVHNWTQGIMRNPRWSPRDPVFYAHHANIDRMWESWLRLGGGRANPTDPAFLRKRIYFFDENGAWKYVLFGQMLDTNALGYSYTSHMALPAAGGGAPVSLLMNSHVGRIPASDVGKIAMEPRYLLIRGLKGLQKLPATDTYGIFGNPPSTGSLAAASASYLGAFYTVSEVGHEHSVAKPRTVSLEVTGKLSLLLRAGANELKFRVYAMAGGKATGSGIDLEAERVIII